MCLDGSPGDVQLLGDLTVAVALGGEGGDTVLGGSERVEAGECGAARARTGGAEFSAGAVGEPVHAAVVSQLESLAQRGASVRPAVRAAECGTEIHERAGVLE